LKNTPISNFIKICPVGDELMDGRTDMMKQQSLFVILWTHQNIWLQMKLQTQTGACYTWKGIFLSK